jgi:hypothetical protein
MSLIKKPHELSVQTKIKCLIYGQAGTGKTTLSLSAPKPLILDFDGGIHRVNYGHQPDGTLQVRSWADCEAVLKEDLSAYETLVVDTGGKMLDYMASYIVLKNPKMGRSNGGLTLQGFGERKGMFRQFCKTVMLMDKHIVFVAHRETQRNGDDIRYVPLFGGSSYDDLVTELDLVGYMETAGRQRTITFDPTDRNDGKNTCNLPAVMELPRVVDDKGNALQNTFLQDSVINPYISNLRKRIEDGKMFDMVMSVITENVTLITDAVSANDFVERCASFEHACNSKEMARQLMTAKAKELGLTFNKETKKYE